MRQFKFISLKNVIGYPRKSSLTLRIIAFTVTQLTLTAHLKADSAISLLSGFDQSRIEAIFPPTETESFRELAKLVYKVRSINQASLEALLQPSAMPEIGDALLIKGELAERKRVKIPEDLQEYLGFDSLYFLQIKTGSQLTRIVTPSIASSAQQGDRINAVGVALQIPSEDDGGMIACGRIGWFSGGELSPGEHLLEANQFDLSLLPGLADRNRLTLLAEDGDAFYSMLSSAKAISLQDELPLAATVNPVELLRDGDKMIGEWFQIELEGVQVTKIAVTSKERQEQLGSNHYFQIDAIGDLGGVVIKIEMGDQRDPATFKTRYPVSIVIRDLPNFLEEKISSNGDQSVISSIRGRFLATGFFFRLWGYESEFMQQKGGGEQFGPLIVAASIQNREPSEPQPIGVEKIGSLAAVTICFGILGIWAWQRRLNATDRIAKQKRSGQESMHVDLAGILESEKEENSSEP